MNENQIDRYLLNLLTPEEVKSFEEELQNNESLYKEMIQQKELISNIEGFGRIEMKERLQQIHKEFELNSSKPFTKYRRLFYRVAISAIFLGAICVGFWWIQQSPSSADLYAQNFEPYELSLTQRSEENKLKQVENLYNDKKYDQAIPLIEAVLRTIEVKPSRILLALGISYLQTDQTTKAITQFNAILASNDFNFEDEAQWFLGLSYLKTNDIEKAKTYLNRLATDSKRDHHQDAKKILSKLK